MYTQFTNVINENYFYHGNQCKAYISNGLDFISFWNKNDDAKLYHTGSDVY